MPYAISYEVPSNEEIYARVNAEIGDERPPELIVHLVVKGNGGLRHFEVWGSKEGWERFRDERVLPAVGKVLSTMGFTEPPPPPDEQEMAVVDVWTGAA